MKTIRLLVLILGLVSLVPAAAGAKSYGAEVFVTANFDVQDVSLVAPGDVVTVEVQFFPTSDLKRLTYTVLDVVNGSVTSASPAVFEDLVQDEKKAVLFKVTVSRVPCSFSVHYVTETGRRTDWGVSTITLGGAKK